MTERRRFPRIQLETVNLSSHALSHALVTGWKRPAEAGYRPVELKVYDISFLGLASDQVADVQEKEAIDLQLQLGANENVAMKAKVVRRTEGKLALQLFELSGEAHLAIDRFLQEKLVGYQMRLVTKKFYNPNEGFDYWFHGPKSTNLILWMPGGKLERAFFETDEDILLYEDGRLNHKPADEAAPNRGFSYEYDIEWTAESEAERPSTKVVRKFLQILGQISGHDEVIFPFRRVLEKQVA